MPSARRLRLLMVAVMAVVVTTMFFTSRMRTSSAQDNRTIQDFYHKTMNAIDHKHGGSQAIVGGQETVIEPHIKDKDGDGTVDDDDIQLAREMSERLRAAEQKAKEQANKKAPLPPDLPSEVIGVGSSAEGQHRLDSKSKPKGGKPSTEDDEDLEDAQAEHEVEVALDLILKKSPVIIFSKSYCPYSKKAKGLLLSKYSIDPVPYVVELDEHPLGPKLQEKLAKLTGRKTVPNILINGQSVGGSDELADLDSRKTLIDKFKSMGKQKFVMKERFDANGDQS